MSDDLLSPNATPNSAISTSGNVRRLNKKPLYIMGTIVVVILMGMFYALYSRSEQSAKNEEEIKGVIESRNAMANQLTAGIGDGVLDRSREEPQQPALTVEKEQPVRPYAVMPPAENQPPSPPQTRQEDPEAKRIAQLVREFREQNYYEALTARTLAENTGQFGKKQAQPNNGASSSPQDPNAVASQKIGSILRSLQAQGISSATGAINSKAAFAKTGDPYKYSNSVRQAQLTPYEVRVGSIIPAVMVSGINSDLPGEIIAQVSHDVRDSKTGRYVLIPQGSKLIGRYDNQIAIGQKRVMIAWHRIQFPDASVFSLGNMGAVDVSGYAGMKDKVNNHTWSIFKNAFLLSVIGAGSQVLIGDNESENENSPSNIARAEIGKQFGQVGAQMIRRNLNVQPTLEIRPGYRFNVMVNKDLILSPY